MEKFNKQMLDLMRNHDHAAPLPGELRDVLDAGIVESCQTFIFKSFYSDNVHSCLKFGRLRDLSGFEYTQNKIHLEDYCKKDNVVSVAFNFLDELTLVLQNAFVQKPVILVLSFQLDSEFGDLASVTFYCEREGQSVIDMKSIDGYSHPLFVRLID